MLLLKYSLLSPPLERLSRVADILIIDDEAPMRHLLRVILERSGHTVAEACNGAEGVRACAEWSFDLVLCDILMPEREGLETIRELRRTQPWLRIIAMSGGISNSSMDPLRMAALLGACATLPKPFRVEKLLQTVNESLSNWPLQARTAV
jgi:CheY-like chemotaxis protein